MQEPVLNPIANLANATSAVNTINANSVVTATALQNTLDRYGSSPNQMQSVLDMNSYNIVNLPAPATINSPARLIDVVNNPTLSVTNYLPLNNTFSGNNTFTGTTTFSNTVTLPFTVRTILSTPLTLYVSSTGNDSNNGLTSGTPFLTIQHAYDLIANNYDLAGNVVTIQLANGTYTAGLITCKGVVGGNGPGSVVIQGSSTPANVTISTTSTDCFGIGEAAYGAGTNGVAQLTVCGLTMTTTTGGNCVNVSGGGCCVVVGAAGFPVTFGASAAGHMVANHGAFIIQGGNAYNITGGATIHANAVSNGVIALHGATVTITNTPAFTYFANTATNGSLFMDSMTFTGSATGTRYFANGGVIYALSGATYLPGNTAGVSLYPGAYLANGNAFSIVQASASIAGSASLNIPAGVTVSAPNAGDVWNDGTNVNLKGSFAPTAGVTTPASIALQTATATAAGGEATPFLTFGSAGLGMFFGTGVPSGLTAPVGSIYVRVDGGAGTAMYLCTVANTTWVAV